MFGFFSRGHVHQSHPRFISLIQTKSEICSIGFSSLRPVMEPVRGEIVDRPRSCHFGNDEKFSLAVTTLTLPIYVARTSAASFYFPGSRLYYLSETGVIYEISTCICGVFDREVATEVTCLLLLLLD